MMIGAIEMASPKQRRPVVQERPSAIPKTETAKVAHPRLEGHIEIVRRVVDTLESMRKRKQLGEREYQAADRIRMAQERLYGATGGVMDMDRARGGSLPGQPPGDGYMLASETMRQTKFHLYPQDYAVVHRVCALGFSIEEAAANLYRQGPTRGEKEDCGRRLREGLKQMADKWFPENRGSASRMRSHVSERATVTDAETVEKASGVAHATRDRVYRGSK